MRSEIKSVTWPNRKEVSATTVVVIIASIFFGFYLFAVDFGVKGMSQWLFRRLVRQEPSPDESLPNNKIWYIIHTYSGFERKVAESLRSV